ncbi:hypothetical protein BDZ89DRAFT_1179482 [Hymenopellis radicata]|nr:hypothetical protein BDZ89DRAFT_1179482 [Hymenopellis radicata]
MLGEHPRAKARGHSAVHEGGLRVVVMMGVGEVVVTATVVVVVVVTAAVSPAHSQSVYLHPRGGLTDIRATAITAVATEWSYLVPHPTPILPTRAPAHVGLETSTSHRVTESSGDSTRVGHVGVRTRVTCESRTHESERESEYQSVGANGPQRLENETSSFLYSPTTTTTQDATIVAPAALTIVRRRVQQRTTITWQRLQRPDDHDHDHDHSHDGRHRWMKDVVMRMRDAVTRMRDADAGCTAKTSFTTTTITTTTLTSTTPTPTPTTPTPSSCPADCPRAIARGCSLRMNTGSAWTREYSRVSEMTRTHAASVGNMTLAGRRQRQPQPARTKPSMAKPSPQGQRTRTRTRLAARMTSVDGTGEGGRQALARLASEDTSTTNSSGTTQPLDAVVIVKDHDRFDNNFQPNDDDYFLFTHFVPECIMPFSNGQDIKGGSAGLLSAGHDAENGIGWMQLTTRANFPTIITDCHPRVKLPWTGHVRERAPLGNVAQPVDSTGLLDKTGGFGGRLRLVLS